MDLTITDSWSPEDEKAIYDPLVAYNVERFGPSDMRNLGIFLRDGYGNIEGGLIGRTARGWLYTQLIFIPDHLRGKGLAGQLLAKAEDEAKARGCIGAYIDSMNPDAVRTYRKCGYEIAGNVGPFTAGNGITWMSKRF